MGYSYGRTRTGATALACDKCGTVGGVKKRTCKYKVSGSTLRSPTRYSLPYCPAPALCDSCYRALGGLNGVHGERCRDGAAAMQRKDDAEQAKLDAGDKLVVSASGRDDGLVAVTFAASGYTSRETYLMADADYDPRISLSEYRQLDVVMSELTS